MATLAIPRKTIALALPAIAPAVVGTKRRAGTIQVGTTRVGTEGEVVTITGADTTTVGVSRSPYLVAIRVEAWEVSSHRP